MHKWPRPTGRKGTEHSGCCNPVHGVATSASALEQIERTQSQCVSVTACTESAAVGERVERMDRSGCNLLSVTFLPCVRVLSCSYLPNQERPLALRQYLLQYSTGWKQRPDTHGLQRRQTLHTQRKGERPQRCCSDPNGPLPPETRLFDHRWSTYGRYTHALHNRMR